jgi:hypothetical protein
LYTIEVTLFHPLNAYAAHDVQRDPGVTVYTTSATVAQVADFYQKQLPATGWKLDGQPTITKQAGLLDFKRGTSQLTVFIRAGEGGNTVRVVLMGSL